MSVMTFSCSNAAKDDELFITQLSSLTKASVHGIGDPRMGSGARQDVRRATRQANHQPRHGIWRQGHPRHHPTQLDAGVRRGAHQGELRSRSVSAVIPSLFFFILLIISGIWQQLSHVGTAHCQPLFICPQVTPDMGTIMNNDKRSVYFARDESIGINRQFCDLEFGVLRFGVFFLFLYDHPYLFPLRK